MTPARLKELRELATANPYRWNHTAELLDEVERLRAALRATEHCSCGCHVVARAALEGKP
jgi:hypothetical protein